MAIKVQSMDVSAVTNGRGRVSIDFDGKVDQVVASSTVPFVNCSASVTGAEGKEVTVVFWNTAGHAVANKRVSASLVAVTH